MSTGKETFIVSIQSVHRSIEEMTERLKQTRQLCDDILEELRDESKLGSFAEFDFGKEQLEEEGRKLYKEMHTKLGGIEKQLKTLFLPMKEEQTRLASKMKDQVDKK